MKQRRKVIHVELITPPYGSRKHYYFGSVAAIYEQLPEEIIGIKKESLWNINLDKAEYRNKLCIIRIGVLIQKTTKRGAKMADV